MLPKSSPKAVLVLGEGHESGIRHRDCPSTPSKRKSMSPISDGGMYKTAVFGIDAQFNSFVDFS